MRKVLSLALALGLGLAATTAHAQVNNASINATATVQAPINVAAAANLDFQAVFPGVNKIVAVTDPTAGRWDVTGQASTPVSLTFTLPANLTRTGGSEVMPIIDYRGNHNTTATPSGTAFVPSGTATPATLSSSGALFVFIGATVTPTAVQAAGVYTAAVTLTVQYN